MWCIIVWNVCWKLACNFAKQIPRNRLQQFVFRLHLHNTRWDGARIASASVTLYSTKSLSIKRRCSLSTDPPIITQKPGVQASPLLHSPPETLSVRWRDIIAAFIQCPSSFEALKKLFKSAPLKSIDARLQQGNVLWRYGNVWEGNRVSRPAICSWFCSSSRWTCSNAFVVNKMLTQQYIFDHSFFDIIGEAELKGIPTGVNM